MPNFESPQFYNQNISQIETPDIPEYELEEGVEETYRRIIELKEQQLESVVVLVAGGSASGKTSAVAAELKTRFGEEALLLSMDDYYRGLKYMESMKEQGVILNWDQPEALNLELFSEHLSQLKRGETIQKPKYDFSTCESNTTETIDSRKIIIVEGLFALNDAVKENGDINVFVEVGTHGRIIRRLLRDIERTGQAPEDILSYFASVVEPMNEQHIDNTSKNADIIIKNEYNPDKEARGMHEVQLKFPGSISLSFLRSLGAERLGIVSQKDIYYQPKDRDLEETGELLRIREENGVNILTYKGPKVESEYRKRPKFEFEIDDATRVQFEKIYGDSVKAINKDRVLYQLDGVVFSLDIVEKVVDDVRTELGEIIEIRSVNKDESIKPFIEKIGLNMDNADKRSYAEM